MAVRSLLADGWARLARRYPRLRWVGKWGVSIASLAFGLAVLFVFRRGLPDIPWIVGYLLLLWLTFAVYAEVRARPLAAGGAARERERRLVLGAVDYTIQTLCHNLLLFILPAYYASATLTSVNAWFLLAIVGGGVVTAVDPWYRAVVQPRRWLYHALFAFATFATLNVALPLVGVPPFWALGGSAALAALAVTPALRPAGRSWTAAGGRALAFAAVAVALLLSFRSWIPPAPLHLAYATLARDVWALEPVGRLRSPLAASDVRAWGSLVAYTAVYAPAGLRQPIAHVWKRDGARVTVVPLSPVRGGRPAGFRTYSRKSDWGEAPAGRWEVDVVTSHGQLIGRLSFAIRD